MITDDIKIESHMISDDRYNLNDPIVKQIAPYKTCGFIKVSICIFRTCGEFYCRKHYPQHDIIKHFNAKTPPVC